MASTRWVLLQHRRGWSIGHFSTNGLSVEMVVPASDTGGGWADRMREYLSSHGYAGEGILLGLDSWECLARATSLEDASLARDRQALAYAWEVWFPLVAEELVMDFAISGQEVLGVAVRIASVNTLVQSLEDRGVAVQSIVPTALLALQSVCPWHRATGTQSVTKSTEVVLWRNLDEIELFVVKDGRPADWRIVPAASLARELEVLSLVVPGPLDVTA